MINRQITIIAAIICALAAAAAFAEPDDGSSSSTAKKDETRFRLSGSLETGIDINYRANRDDTRSRMIGKGGIDISARPVNRVRAEFGIEYNMRDTFVVIDKLYAQYNITKDGTIRTGIMKKSFGLEERTSTDERYFTRRSIINSGDGKGLEDLGFLGHDLTLLYRHDVNKNLRVSGGLSWSVEDSLRYLQNYSAQYTVSNDLIIVLAAIIRHYNIPEWITQIHGVDGISTTFVSSLSARYGSKVGITEAELTLGTNPRIKIQENNRNALILGIRAKEQFPINTPWKTLRQVIPLIETALYWDDFESGNFDTQVRAGLTFGFAKNSAFQFRNTFGTIWRTADGETNVRRHRFDSQAIVIF
jgi:hypothetical protein